jgi:hypothetical protein
VTGVLPSHVSTALYDIAVAGVSPLDAARLTFAAWATAAYTRPDLDSKHSVWLSSASILSIKSCGVPIGSSGVAVPITGRSGNGRLVPAVGGARSLSEGPNKCPALRMPRLRCATMLATPVFSHKTCCLYT